MDFKRNFTMVDNSSDQEMDLDFIHKPRVPFRRLFRPNAPSVNDMSNSNDQLRPTTPPNVVTNMSSPLSSSNLGFPMEEDDTSFIRRPRVGTNKSFVNRLRFTSTPDPCSGNLSKSMPHEYPQQMIDSVNKKSADTSQRIGTDLIPIEYVNPFTPDGKVLTSKSSTNKSMQSLTLGGSIRKPFVLDDSMDSLKNDSVVEPPPRCRLSEFNVSRFNEEFIKLQDLGSGVHGCVYKCLNKINGCVYAVKRTIKPIQSSTQERFIRKEIYAHGILDHPNIVRNYSCWKEDGFVYIQNEYCNGNSFDQYMSKNKMNEDLLKGFLLQMASALSYLHKKGLAHLDIKPENILLSIEKSRERSINSDGGSSEGEKVEEEITFKLGDFGHITRLDDEDVEEGDCRYLCREILNEQYDRLDKADIFALGLTVYEAAGGAGGKPLPMNGLYWHELRDGILKDLPEYSESFNNILKEMVTPEPSKRPSAFDLIKQLKPSPIASSVDDIHANAHLYRLGKTILYQKVETSDHYFKALWGSHKQLQEQLSPSTRHDKPLSPVKDRILTMKKKGGGAVTKSRLVGRKTTRSYSAPVTF